MFLSENIDQLLGVISPDFTVLRGDPLPLGSFEKADGINFAVFSSNAESMSLLLFVRGEKDPFAEIPLDRRYNRTGDVWHAFVRGLKPCVEYGYRAGRQPRDDMHIHMYRQEQLLVDPYARALSMVEYPGEDGSQDSPHRQWRCLIARETFDWEFDQPLNIHLADSVIYELHVRGFSCHDSAGVSQPGTFAGIIEKIPYLQELGVTAVELMPVNEFDEEDNPRSNPRTGELLKNYWGYSPLAFFAPKASYAADSDSGGTVREFKRMVKALHEAGIEVILDMVFNHTGEGDARGPTVSFRGLDNAVYYLIDSRTGRYHNYSGCGNTMNCNHPVVRDMVLDCLSYWVTEMHVDGFRFDLASILGRGRDGEVLSNPPLLEHIAGAPVLANTKLIAEAWDAAGLYQVGTFPHWGRWSEWNGKYRDDIRGFVKGDQGMVSLLATRLSGSADLYQGSDRAPYHSINFITSHDGFTLADLVSYNEKHNEDNGENGRDGANDNLSWNCGEEGQPCSPEIAALRCRQMKNFTALLLLSQGTPMILSGDEMGRTQRGNNNAYCQDNDISWNDWVLLEQNRNLFRFYKLLIRFRKNHAVLRRRSFDVQEGDRPSAVSWHGFRCGQPDWSDESRSLGMLLRGIGGGSDIFVVANADWQAHRFEIPQARDGQRWCRFIDTALDAPRDICEEGEEFQLEDQQGYEVADRTVIVLIAG